MAAVATGCSGDEQAGRPSGTADTELFDQRITFQQAVQRLRDDDDGRVSRAIVQLGPMAERAEFRRLLLAVWARDRASFPDLNWSTLETQRVRIAVARVLGNWQPDDARYREYVVAMSQHAAAKHDKVEALLALGSFGRAEDLATLETVATGNDELLASGALAGLIASKNQQGRQALERISIDPSMSEQRRKLARQLLALPRPPG